MQGPLVQQPIPDEITGTAPQTASLCDSCPPFTSLSSNPHCAQRALMPASMQLPPAKFLPLSSLPRILSPSSPRAAYCHVPHAARSTNHWGQRKLLLCEVEFLSAFIPLLRARTPPPKRIVVVYAGAAPGTHIPYLFDLFDNKTGDLQFALFDPGAPLPVLLSALLMLSPSAFWNIWPRRSARFDFDEISICPAEAGSPNGFFTDDVARWLAPAPNHAPRCLTRHLSHYRDLCDSQGYATLFIR